jgi:pimeloyl-ACP methyl ester carboxylesterase
VTLHTHEWGTRGDVPVVFWCTRGRVELDAPFADVAQVLARAGFHAVAIDGPAEETDALPRLAALLREHLDELELDRPVLVGNSSDGAVAIACAAAYPDDVRALVLFDGDHHDDERLAAYVRAVADHSIPTLVLVAADGGSGEVRAAVGEEIAAWITDHAM